MAAGCSAVLSQGILRGRPCCKWPCVCGHWVIRNEKMLGSLSLMSCPVTCYSQGTKRMLETCKGIRTPWRKCQMLLFYSSPGASASVLHRGRMLEQTYRPEFHPGSAMSWLCACGLVPPPLRAPASSLFKYAKSRTCVSQDGGENQMASTRVNCLPCD